MMKIIVVGSLEYNNILSYELPWIIFWWKWFISNFYNITTWYYKYVNKNITIINVLKFGMPRELGNLIPTWSRCLVLAQTLNYMYGEITWYSHYNGLIGSPSIYVTCTNFIELINIILIS